jgi:long-chain acyl-CoA synthetase
VDGRVIVRDGHALDPREVEVVLMTHPGVRRATVVGVPHESHGEEVKAFVIRRPGVRVTGDELIWWCKRRLPADRYPRLVEFRDILPV